MSRVRASKQALKRQRDALARFRRYLPTLLLKKRQLQMEVRRAESLLEDCDTELAAATAGVGPWIGLLADELPYTRHLGIGAVRETTLNVAGVEVPVLEGIDFHRTPPDLQATPAFLDDALEAMEEILRLRITRRLLEARRARLVQELRVTSQRVNLFEKVKIPEAERAIRVIRIALGDLQAAEVVRAKIAKGKSAAKEAAS